MKELKLVKRRPANAFPNTEFARPSHREQSTDAGTETILAFDGVTTRTRAEIANP